MKKQQEAEKYAERRADGNALAPQLFNRAEAVAMLLRFDSENNPERNQTPVKVIIEWFEASYPSLPARKTE